MPRLYNPKIPCSNKITITPILKGRLVKYQKLGKLIETHTMRLYQKI